MLPEPCASLKDILEATAVSAATTGADESAYGKNRLVPSATEREFILIGEALKVTALFRALFLV